MNYIVAFLLKYITEEEDAFWSLIYVMYEKNQREVFDPTSGRIAILLDNLGAYIKKRHPKLWKHFQKDKHFTMEASFSSQIITMFIYDAP